MIRVPDAGDYGQPADLAVPRTDWNSCEHHVSIRGRRVRYVDVGAGPFGFVCVHGLGGCWQHYSQILPSLTRRGRAIALDLPGFGASQMPAQPMHRPSLLHPGAVAAILAGAGARGALPTARAIGRSHPYGGLEQIHRPILSIGGTHDHIVPIADLESFARDARVARTILLEGCGHLVMLERPQAVVEQIDRLLEELPLGGDAGRDSPASQRPPGA